MSDLTRLNPTPHAIAVYASQPLSPVTTQHSLPSGRYPLLGPDFHRLDRTSFVLAYLFDHLVAVTTPRALCWRRCELCGTRRPCRPKDSTPGVVDTACSACWVLAAGTQGQ